MLSMDFEKGVNWQFIYKNNYRNQVENFYDYILAKRDGYSNLSKKSQQLITEKYLNIFKKTLKIFEIFFANNCYFISEDRLIVVYILSCNILKDGMPFYRLYLTINKIEKKKQEIKKLYLSDKYIDLFKEIEYFFEQRLKLESSYGL